MSKNLAFGGKGLNIVNGSRVVHRSYGKGTVQGIRFNNKSIPTEFQVRWDTQLTTWVHRKEVKPSS